MVDSFKQNFEYSVETNRNLVRKSRLANCTSKVLAISKVICSEVAENLIVRPY